ncbi:MAG: type II toxin-antitoxin system PemK/MazF family toxin [Thermodesulfobacteriota bacterium]
MKIGDICWVNLDPTVGDEIRKKRPVVILNAGNERYLKLAIVVPVTGWKPHLADNPFFVNLEPSTRNGLEKKSSVDCFQIRAVSHKRVMGRLGSVSETALSQIKKSLALILDIEPEDCED